MAFRFTIGRRIGFGFAIFILLMVVAFITTVDIVRDNKAQTTKLVEQVAKSVAELKELSLLLQKCRTDISKWVYNSSSNDVEFRRELRGIIDADYPHIKENLLDLSKGWESKEKDSLMVVFKCTEQLVDGYNQEIINKLNNIEAYNDLEIRGTATMHYEDSEEFIEKIYRILNNLIKVKTQESSIVKDEMFKSFQFLKTFVESLGFALVFGGILIALFTTRSITRPVYKLKKVLLSMGMGILPEERIHVRNDEIGEMESALNELIQSMHHTTDFAKETGSGNFDARYTPLSKDDNLGHALLKMRDDLAENERSLEQKVKERTEEVVKQKEEIQEKTDELQILYKQVTDSIHYAKRIQEAILPPNKFIAKVLPQSFVFYKPKDIVSGDFYWIEKKSNLVYFAAVDCTGHGVPGAFMSLVGHNILKDIISNTNITKPSEIMDRLREGVVSTLHSDKSGKETRDGMDMTLCCIDYATLELQYAAAFNPLYIVRDNSLMECKANKFPIGSFVGEKENFKNHTIQLQKNDQIYIFSDGYADQFGGPRGKKFMVSNFRNLLTKIASVDPSTQKQVLESTLDDWQKRHEQVDDVLVIGVKI